MSNGMGRAMWGVAVTLGVALVAWSHRGAIDGGPVFDDHFLVVGSTCFRSLDGIARTLSFDPTEGCAYRPLRYLSYGVDFALGGPSFAAHHIGNVARHVVAFLIAVALAGRILAVAAGRSVSDGAVRAGALAAGLWWALLPAQTDSVSYVSGRRDILVGVWSLLALWAALRAESSSGRAAWWNAGAVGATLVAMLAKESAVVVPALWLLWRLREFDGTTRSRVPRGVWVGGAVLAVAGLAMIWTWGIAHPRVVEKFAWWGGTPVTNLRAVLGLGPLWVEQLMGVGPLIGDYHPRTIELPTSWSDARVLAGVALVSLPVVGAVTLRRRAPDVAFALVFPVVAIAPMSHLIPHHELFAEHYVYFAAFGPSLGVGAVVRRLSDGGPAARVAGAILVGLGLTFFAARITARNLDWADEETFWAAVIREAPQNVRARYNLARILLERQELGRAVDVLAPLADDPTLRESRFYFRAMEDLSRVGELADRPVEAERGSRLVLAMDPEHRAALRRMVIRTTARSDWAGALRYAERWWRASGDGRAVGAGAYAALRMEMAEAPGWIAEALAGGGEPAAALGALLRAAESEGRVSEAAWLRSWGVGSAEAGGP